MDVFLLDAVRSAHLVGLALGLGPALLADGLALRAVLRPVTDRDTVLLAGLHQVILVGLAVLWASGLVLVYMRTGFDPAQFTPKLILKLAVVIVLSVNAAVIGRFALPRYASQTGKRLGEIETSIRYPLSVIGGISLSCWFSALALGGFSQLKPMSAEGLQMVFGPLFVAGLAGAVAVAAAAAVMLTHQHRHHNRPPMWHGAAPPEVIYL